MPTFNTLKIWWCSSYYDDTTILKQFTFNYTTV